MAASQSEMASPAAVVEILMTQNRTVTSGTFAASGCWVNTRSSERTVGSSGHLACRWEGQSPPDPAAVEKLYVS